MMVRQAIMVGRSDDFAAWIDPATASGSWPSTASVFQPAARKRAAWSSELLSSTGPSMVMRLSSHSTISLLRFRWPASEIASWLMPSIRQPSPAST